MPLALACLLSCVLTGGAGDAPDLGDVELVVSSFRNGELDLFAVDPATGSARNLTRTPLAKEKYPACSPDGKLVAFVSDREGGDGLYLMDRDGEDVRHLAKGQEGNAGMPSWTADGAWIYFGLFKGPPRMCRIRPDGSDFSVVGEGIDPAISPDGKKLAFARAEGDGHHLYVADSDGSNAKRLTDRGNGWAGVHATWTPDNRRIIFADKAGEALELFAAEPDSGKTTPLTKLGQAATSPSVSPDGKWVTFRLCDEIYWRSGPTAEKAYKERRADKRPVWVMGADGSNPQVIEPLHYQTTIDGSRAPFLKRPPSSTSP